MISGYELLSGRASGDGDVGTGVGGASFEEWWWRPGCGGGVLRSSEGVFAGARSGWSCFAE